MISIKHLLKDYIIYNLSIALVIVALLLTESTGAFIALVGSMFAYYILKEKKDIRGLIAICIIVGISSILFVIIQNKLANTTPIGELITSFNSRYHIWIGSINMILKKVNNIFVPGSYDKKLNLGTIIKMNCEDELNLHFKVNDRVLLTKGADVVQVNQSKLFIYKHDMIIATVED